MLSLCNLSNNNYLPFLNNIDKLESCNYFMFEKIHHDYTVSLSNYMLESKTKSHKLLKIFEEDEDIKFIHKNTFNEDTKQK